MSAVWGLTAYTVCGLITAPTSAASSPATPQRRSAAQRVSACNAVGTATMIGDRPRLTGVMRSSAT